jgi:hypothetical protein
MTVWQGGERFWAFVVSTGMTGYPTRRGTFAVQSKIPNAWSSPWQLWMPYWLGIYWAGGSENGIHGLPWNAKSGVQVWTGYVGKPITYGCVMLDNVNAKRLYDVAYIGMPVIDGYDAAAQARGRDPARGIAVGDEAETRPPLPGVETGQVGAQPLGQHRNHIRRQVQRGAAPQRLVVHRLALGDEVRNVGDMHAQAPAAGRQRLERERVVNLAGFRVVNAHRGQGAEVLASGRVGKGRQAGAA